MYTQMKALGKMGTLQKIMGLLPGMSKMSDKIDYEATQSRLSRYRIIMDSMTAREKDEPSIIKGNRIDRIAVGAGVPASEVRDLLKQYNNSKKTMSAVSKDRKMRRQLAKQMGGMDPDALKELKDIEGGEK